MPMSVYIAFAVVTVLSVLAAQRLAKRQGRRPVPWMVAATILGPFTLIPLALNA